MSADSSEDNIVITDSLTDRYASLSLIPWWSQQRIADARIMVVGAGALGNEVLKNLALVGIGNIFIIDFDTIEDANLTRAVLFRASDNGRSKAEVAAERVKELNPDVKVKCVDGDVTRSVGLGVFRRMDVVIGCLDNRDARLFVNRACWKVGTPWVDGAIEEMNGIARAFVPPDGACYECTLTENDYRLMNVRYSCPGLTREDIVEGKIPTTPTIASIIAGIQTQDALKLLHGRHVEGGAAVVFNGLTNDCYPTRYPRKKDCESHYTYVAVAQLDRSVGDTTVGEMLDIARRELAADAVLELDEDLVVNVSCSNTYCTECGNTSVMYTPLKDLRRVDVACPGCGEDRALEMTCTVDGADGELLRKKLEEIGMPPLHIVATRAGSSYQYFELSGDENGTMDFR